MSNLERQQAMSAGQLGVVIFTACLGTQIIVDLRPLIAVALQWSWLSAVVGIIGYFGGLCLVLELAAAARTAGVPVYLRQLFGIWGGGCFCCGQRCSCMAVLLLNCRGQAR